MIYCISAARHKLNLYHLSQGKTSRSINKFKKYKNVILELSGTRQSLALAQDRISGIRYIEDAIIPYTENNKS